MGQASDVRDEALARVAALVERLRAINDGTDKTGQSLAPIDLAGYARHDAVRSLLENWESALYCDVAEGGKEVSPYVRYLLRDVDDVIAELEAFKRAVIVRFGLDKQAQDRCIECNRPATWIRQTQFAGDHPFCERHAREEANFGLEDPSSFVWKAVSAQEEGDNRAAGK